MNVCPSHPLLITNRSPYFSLIPLVTIEWLKTDLKPPFIERDRN